MYTRLSWRGIFPGQTGLPHLFPPTFEVFKPMAPRTRRALFSVTLFLASCALLGSFISDKVAAQSASDESTLRDSLHQFTDVYSLVEQNYAEPLDQDKVDKAIYDGAIPGMLHALDPHSNFYDPKAFAQMREEQHPRHRARPVRGNARLQSRNPPRRPDPFGRR
jgi:hypothetical protein